MQLAAGTRLGEYEILVPIGAGGMGEVYRARDGKLHRDVALKILPNRLASESDRITRFGAADDSRLRRIPTRACIECNTRRQATPHLRVACRRCSRLSR
jgi:serine/threonine protein kinase